MEDNRRQSILNESLINFYNNSQNNFTQPKVIVEPCQVEFFYEKFKQCYPMFKNPRGQCLIINIYQINGMPPRRWSDRDTEALKQLFEQLLFNVRVYSDSTHDLNCQNFKNIIQEFSHLKEHEDAQSCIVCLMSHGEEGYLTTKEGNKILLDDIFTMFNNINCPNLAGKPKLFFIQSCRDDPINGPAEDLGIRLSFSLSNKSNTETSPDEIDGAGHYSLSDNNVSSHQKQKSFYLNNSNHSSSSLLSKQIPSLDSQVFYHIPSLCDMLIGYPTQKGFIAYRKPEIGSWYMNAIVQVFSKHSHNTDLCAMLNMVNSLISNEVTNTGKKQMSEYTSKLTKPYFYFFPGLASDPNDQLDEEDEEDEIENDHLVKENVYLDDKKHKYDSLNSIDNFLNKRKRTCIENFYPSSEHGAFLFEEQTDSNFNLKKNIDKFYLSDDHIDFLADKAKLYWKHIAREMDINENKIIEIDRNNQINNKLKIVLNLWLRQCAIQLSNSNENSNFFQNFYLKQIIKILTNCRLNKIKYEFLETFSLKQILSN